MSSKFSPYTAGNDYRTRIKASPDLAKPLDTEAPSKDLAIKLAVRELERLTDEPDYNLQQFRARAVVSNLLRGLGCEAVVGAWSELL
jgi:hypothetical protein